MTGLEVFLGVVGFIVTCTVLAGMVLITPRGYSSLDDGGDESQGEHLSRAGVERTSSTPS